MKKERESIVEMVQKLDKNIKDTEKLLESFLPNLNNVLLQKKHVQVKEETKTLQKLSEFWQKTKEKALKRCEKDCPICYNPFNNEKETYLLSCSHLFHKCCLESFEKFDFSEKMQCPMCRHPNYQKVVIQI